MALEGKIVNRNGVLYVLYESRHDSEPKTSFMFWRIERTAASHYGFERPEEGDLVTYYSGSGVWNARSAEHGRSTGSVWTAEKADHVETVSVPAPPARGKELRWYRGRWERLLKKGWVPA